MDGSSISDSNSESEEESRSSSEETNKKGRNHGRRDAHEVKTTKPSQLPNASKIEATARWRKNMSVAQKRRRLLEKIIKGMDSRQKR